MPWQEIIGFVAGFGTTIAAMPDLLSMLRRHSSQGMNPTMAAIMGMSQVVWIYYGLLIGSTPVVLWNVMAVIINFGTVSAYWYFISLEKRGRWQGK
jgi:MtN3 and saliva related transmembrane protein